MLGFGALKAMNDTIKLNRENLKANKRKPFSKESIKNQHRNPGEKGTPLIDTVQLTEEERQTLIQKINEENRQERRQKIFVLSVSVAITLILVVTFLVALNEWY